MTLHEEYRPRQWSEVIGQAKALKTIDCLRPRGLTGRYWWVSGQSGTGKTTIAYLIAGEVAEPINTHELDASTLTPAKLREIESNMQYLGWGKGGQAYIVNEAHGLRQDTIRQLEVLYDRLPKHVAIIFTTTSAGEKTLFESAEDPAPLLSRCTQLALARRDLGKAFAARVHAIATKEGLNGRPIEAYERLATSCKLNMRKMLECVEEGKMLAEQE